MRDLKADSYERIGRSLGHAEHITSQEIQTAVETLSKDQTLLQSYAKMGKELIDGKGVERIVDTLIGDT